MIDRCLLIATGTVTLMLFISTFAVGKFASGKVSYDIQSAKQSSEAGEAFVTADLDVCQFDFFSTKLQSA